MSTTEIPEGQFTAREDLEPAEDEVRLDPVQLRAGMIVIADQRSYREGKFFNPYYTPDEPYESVRASQWCRIVEYELKSHPSSNGLGTTVISFIGEHHDGSLVRYSFLMARSTTYFIVKRDSIA